MRSHGYLVYEAMSEEAPQAGVQDTASAGLGRIPNYQYGMVRDDHSSCSAAHVTRDFGCNQYLRGSKQYDMALFVFSVSMTY